MKLQQGQTWKLKQQYIRITHLERLAVQYKTMDDLRTKWGVHHKVTKKEFCRLVKTAVLLSPKELAELSAHESGANLPSDEKTSSDE